MDFSSLVVTVTDPIVQEYLRAVGWVAPLRRSYHSDFSSATYLVEDLIRVAGTTPRDQAPAQLRDVFESWGGGGYALFLDDPIEADRFVDQLIALGDEADSPYRLDDLVVMRVTRPDDSALLAGSLDCFAMTKWVPLDNWSAGTCARWFLVPRCVFEQEESFARNAGFYVRLDDPSTVFSSLEEVETTLSLWSPGSDEWGSFEAVHATARALS